MSAIAGSYARGRAPLQRGAVARMSAALERTGPDGEHCADAPSVRMVSRPFHTDAGSRRHPGPSVSPDGYLLAFAGRLDNAAEVRSTLPAGERGGGTAGLVLAAYRARGIESFAGLVGDFALALWDPRRERLLLACDALGRRPLYYRADGEHVFWATQCRPLLEVANGAARLDDEFVADFLANRVSPGRSPFAGIHAVPGGHVLIAGRGKTELRRYWRPDPDHRIEYRTDAGYEAHFLALFEEAVACRLRADGPVVCELSGGVDSSSIACMADALVRRGAVETPAIHTVSHVYRGAATSDETPFIEAVERHLGRRGVHVHEDEWPLLQPLPPMLRPDLPTGRLAALAAETHVARRMREWGARVILCGIGGDQLFWSQPYPGLPLADHLVRGHVRQLFRTAVAWSRWEGLSLPGTLWQGAVAPLLPRRWQARLQDGERMGEWIDPGFARRMALRGRMMPLPDDAGFRVPSTARQWAMIRDSLRPFALERATGEGYVDVRYPYLDRRLVEFALAIPLEQKVRPPETRSVVRRALRGLVPDVVRTRVGKAGPGEALHRALAREWPRLAPLLSDPLVAAHGYVDRAAFRTALARARHGLTTHEGQLHKTIALELWLRTLEDPSAAPAAGAVPRSGATRPLAAAGGARGA